MNPFFRIRLFVSVVQDLSFLYKIHTEELVLSRNVTDVKQENIVLKK